jgi:coproporphyrinogen III oxidase-like Fe-S oxidoreductase
MHYLSSLFPEMRKLAFQSKAAEFHRLFWLHGKPTLLGCDLLGDAHKFEGRP